MSNAQSNFAHFQSLLHSRKKYVQNVNAVSKCKLNGLAYMKTNTKECLFLKLFEE